MKICTVTTCKRFIRNNCDLAFSSPDTIRFASADKLDIDTKNINKQ